MSTPIHSHVQLYVCKVFVDGVVDGQVVVSFLVSLGCFVVAQLHITQEEVANLWHINE
jgi:hypothetical protein